MIRRKLTPVSETKFLKEESMSMNNRTIYRGDFIKISGEHGGRFKFHSLVTNKETGAQWIDCFEMQKGTVSAWRSFRSDRIKLIPIKRGKRNVNRG
jgi:hypothetical protein